MSTARIPVEPSDLQYLLVGLAHSLHEARYNEGCRCNGCRVGARVWWGNYNALNRDEQVALQNVLLAAALAMPVPADMEGAYDA